MDLLLKKRSWNLQKKTVQQLKFTYELFSAITDWLQNLEKRNHIIFKKVFGESPSVKQSVSTDWIENLGKKMEGFSPENVLMPMKPVFSMAELKHLLYTCNKPKTFPSSFYLLIMEELMFHTQPMIKNNTTFT